MKPTRPKVVVVGAGIVGASVAYHLARRGAAVTLVDEGQPAGKVTGKAFAWINVAHGLPEPYSHLRHHAIHEYRRLEHELKYAFRVNWSGALTWNRDLTKTERFARQHAAWGYDVRLIGRDEIANLEPNLRELPDFAAFAASEGAVDPIAATEALVRAAREAGTDVRLNAEVLALTESHGKVTGISTSEGATEADTVVLAAGVRTGHLCLPLGVTIPLHSSPSILLRIRTPRRLINTVISNPYMEARQISDFVMLCAEDHIDNSAENGPEAVAKRTLTEVRERLEGGGAAELDSVEVGLRPIPSDGLPIIGYAPQVDGLYIAVMHAGVTLAPAIGRFVSTEIIDGVDVKLFTPCRAHRFAN
jgi:glycine/D-amino acid oxidase-like deaminating enzyme